MKIILYCIGVMMMLSLKGIQTIFECTDLYVHNFKENQEEVICENFAISG